MAHPAQCIGRADNVLEGPRVRDCASIRPETALVGDRVRQTRRAGAPTEKPMEMARGGCRWGSPRGDHRDPAPKQIDGRRRQLVVMPLRPMAFDPDVLSAKSVLFRPSPKDNGAMEAWEPGEPSLRKAMDAGKCCARTGSYLARRSHEHASSQGRGSRLGGPGRRPWDNPEMFKTSVGGPRFHQDGGPKTKIKPQRQVKGGGTIHPNLAAPGWPLVRFTVTGFSERDRLRLIAAMQDRTDRRKTTCDMVGICDRRKLVR
jgi:hypothetical protein